MKYKSPENLTLSELQNLVNDLHALMWMRDGCEVCAHCVIVHREPYYKTTCTLDYEHTGRCQPLWRGFAGEPDSFDPDNPSF